MSSTRQTFMLFIALLIITVGLPGCATPVRYTSEPLPLPVRPALPVVTAAELSCLTNDVYKRLATRDLLRRQYAEELEAIIRATHANSVEPMARRPPPILPLSYR